MDNFASPSIRFGHVEIFPARRQVFVAGQSATLGARAFDLLLVLIENQDKVLSKRALLTLVWPGVVVEDNNLTVQISALRKLLGPDAIATVAGRGYRFVLPPGAVEASRPEPADPLGRDRHGSPASHHDIPALPEKPSVVVLPFDNLGGGEEQTYFTAGLTEDLTTELSRFRSLFVIARNSAFTYQGRGVDVRQVARELGVRYVLEGSARRSGERVRVHAQLIDGLSGSHLWADRFDRVIEDIFDLQEELAQHIVAAIASQVQKIEQNIARRLRPGNLRSYDVAMRAHVNGLEAHRRNDRVLWNEALSEARQALEVDRDNLLAHLVIAEMQTKHVAVPQFADGDLKADWKEGITSAGRAMELDPSDSRAYGWAGFLMAVAGFYDEGLGYVRQGYGLNPNDCMTLSNLAATEVWAGEHANALVHVAAAERLSPRDPNRYLFNACRASACFFLNDYAAGVEHAGIAIQEAPHSVMSQISMVMPALACGQLTRAQAAFEAIRRISPAYAQRAVTQDAPFRNPDDRRRFILAARIAAGLEAPERAAELR